MPTNAEQFRELVQSKFRITKYAAARELDAAGWAFNLGTRKQIGEGHPPVWEYQVEAIDYLLSEPILAPGSSPIYLSTVEPLGIAEAWELRDLITDDEGPLRATCEEWNSRSHAQPEVQADPNDDLDAVVLELFDAIASDEAVFRAISGSFDDAIGTNVSKRDYAHLTIKMSAPDDTILADFSQWLKVQRKSGTYVSPEVRKFTQVDFARWAQKRVLAYLDLKSAAGIYGVEVPYHELGSLLFPDIHGVDLAEKVRKTVATEAAFLMEYSTIEALSDVANYERRMTSAE